MDVGCRGGGAYFGERQLKVGHVSLQITQYFNVRSSKIYLKQITCNTTSDTVCTSFSTVLSPIKRLPKTRRVYMLHRPRNFNTYMSTQPRNIPASAARFLYRLRTSTADEQVNEQKLNPRRTSLEASAHGVHQQDPLLHHILHGILDALAPQAGLLHTTVRLGVHPDAGHVVNNNSPHLRPTQHRMKPRMAAAGKETRSRIEGFKILYEVRVKQQC